MQFCINWGKFMDKEKIITTIKGVPSYVKEHWNKPNEGEYLSLSEMVAYMFTQSGTYIFMTFASIMAFGATYFTGSIMGIENVDFATIGIINAIIGIVFILLNPLGVLIYENHGKLPTKTRILAHVAYCAQIILGIGCYFIPSIQFESIIKGLPQLIGNALLVAGITNYFTWLIRRLFSEKHGRLKPIIVFCAFPAAILMSIIPYLPVQNLSYTNKLIVLNFSFALMNFFYTNYTNVNGMVTFMTPNSQERQRLFSIVPIFSGFFSSAISMFLPMLIAITGGYLNIKTYRVFVPIFCFVGAGVSMAALKCKERIIEPPADKRKQVTFFHGAKQVLQNKYFWIINISNTLGQWQWLIGNLLAWWFIYSLRKEWLSGVAANIVVIGMTLGNIACPILTRKFEKRTILVISRLLTVLMCLGVVLAVKMNSIAVFIIAMFLKNTIQPVVDGVNQGINADVQHYHQWRFNERADSMSGVFSWFLNPVIMLMGYIIPMILKGVGFTSDWDVLYDTTILSNVFSIYTWATIFSLVMLTVPYFFYDLTKEKYEKCIEELKQRVELDEDELSEDTANAEEVTA